MNLYRLDIDLKRVKRDVVPRFVQGDTARLEFRVFDNGLPFDMSEYNSVEFAHKLPDGTLLITNGEFNSDKTRVIYNYKGNEMEKVGFITTSFSLLGEDSEERASVQPFIVQIVKDIRKMAASS